MTTRKFFAAVLAAIIILVPTSAWAEPFLGGDDPFGESSSCKMDSDCSPYCEKGQRSTCEKKVCVCRVTPRYEKRSEDSLNMDECLHSCPNTPWADAKACQRECENGFYQCCEALGKNVALSEWDTWCDEESETKTPPAIMPSGKSIHGTGIVVVGPIEPTPAAIATPEEDENSSFFIAIFLFAITLTGAVIILMTLAKRDDEKDFPND